MTLQRYTISANPKKSYFCRLVSFKFQVSSFKFQVSSLKSKVISLKSKNELPHRR